MKVWGAINFFFCSAVVVQLSLLEEGFTSLSLVLWLILSTEVLLIAYFILGLYTIQGIKQSELLDEEEIRKTESIELPLTYNVLSTLLACCFVFIGLLLFANKQLAFNGSWPLMPLISLNLALFNVLVSFTKKRLEQKSDLTSD